MNWYEKFTQNEDYWFVKENFDAYIIDVNYFGNYLEPKKWMQWSNENLKPIMFIEKRSFLGIPSVSSPKYGDYLELVWSHSFKVLLLTNSETIFNHVVSELSKESTLVLGTDSRGRINKFNSNLPPFLPDVYSYRDINLKLLKRKNQSIFPIKLWSSYEEKAPISFLDFPRKKLFVTLQFEKTIIKFVFDLLYYNYIYVDGLKKAVINSHLFSEKDVSKVMYIIHKTLKRIYDIERSYHGLVLEYEGYEDALYLCRFLTRMRIDGLLKDFEEPSEEHKDLPNYNVYIIYDDFTAENKIPVK